MPGFILLFDSRDAAAGAAEPIDLEVATLDQAKVKAAMLYAGASFRPTPPTSFRILQDGQTEVYRFPERA